MPPGQIILLNGTSSAGKSTIAKQLQAVLPQPYLHTGIDHFLAAAPWARLFVYADSTTQTDAEGWFLPFRDGALIDVPRLGPVAYQWIWQQLSVLPEIKGTIATARETMLS